LENPRVENQALLSTNNTKTRNKQNTLSTKEQKERENFEKKFDSLKKFKEFMVSNYAGTFKTGFKKESGLGYLPNTIIELSESGYLRNTVNEKYLDQDEAFKVWDYLFKKHEDVVVNL